MSKSIVVDRVKVIAQMARLDITGEELAQKAGVGRSSIIKMRKGQAVWRVLLHSTLPALWAWTWRTCWKRRRSNP